MLTVQQALSSAKQLHQSRQFEQAIELYRQVIAVWPESVEAWNGLGMALRELGKHADAIAALQRAAALAPNSGAVFNNLGIACKDAGQLDRAIDAYRRAVELRPDSAAPLNNLAVALHERGDLDAAIEAFEHALKLAPDNPEVLTSLGSAQQSAGQLDEAETLFRRAISIHPSFIPAHDNLVYGMHFNPRYGAMDLLHAHREWNRVHAAPLATQIKPHDNDRSPDRRLRVGYVSPDFREHVVGRFILPLLEHHDPQEVEAFCFMTGRYSPDAMTAKIRACCTGGWREIAAMSDDAAAELVRQDRIDILIDLTMHMIHNRMLVFARKPAPVQATYLAYCSTTGLDAIDYRITDPQLDPPDQSAEQYAEKSAWIESYWCYQPHPDTPDVNELPAAGRDDGEITFGSLNNFSKVSVPTLDAWEKLLNVVPRSRLLLHAREGSHRQRVLDRFAAAGFDPDRVQFISNIPTRDYFKQYDQIDIGLDPFPYGGGTTTCDALWMGVPVVTLRGQTAVGRGGASILTQVGLPELIAENQGQYLAIAQALAGDLSKLTQLGSSLRQRMQSSRLMDARAFARDMETAYRRMWRAWCDSSPSRNEPTIRA